MLDREDARVRRAFEKQQRPPGTSKTREWIGAHLSRGSVLSRSTRPRPTLARRGGSGHSTLDPEAALDRQTGPSQVGREPLPEGRSSLPEGQT